MASKELHAAKYSQYDVCFQLIKLYHVIRIIRSELEGRQRGKPPGLPQQQLHPSIRTLESTFQAYYDRGSIFCLECFLNDEAAKPQNVGISILCGNVFVCCIHKPWDCYFYFSPKPVLG